MPAQWTAALVGEMHLKGITAKQLAESAGFRPEYVSMILNGRREPKGAEQKLWDAMNRIIESRDRTRKGDSQCK